MQNIDDVLNQLMVKRSVFHSEKDFQHALAWEIQLYDPSAKLRLEINSPKLDGVEQVRGSHIPRMCMDVLVSGNQGRCGLELKYRTRRLRCRDKDEDFDLKAHSAHDHGRYQFLRDIQRLERFKNQGWIDKGYAIFLTNDPAYWLPSGKSSTNDEKFRLSRNRHITGELKWDKRAGEGTTKGMTDPIVIQGTYTLDWRHFSTVATSKGSHEFCFLLIEVA